MPLAQRVPLRVVADVQQHPARVHEPVEAHGPRQRVRPVRQIGAPQLRQPGAQRDQAGAEVPAVHRGNVAGRERREGLRLIPVIQVAPQLRQRLDGAETGLDPRQTRVPRHEAKVDGGEAGQQPQTDVRGAGPVGDAGGRAALVVVRGQKVVLRSHMLVEIAPGLPRGLQQPGPVLRSQLRRARVRQGEQTGAERRQQPEQAHGLSQRSRREEQQDQPRQRRGPERGVMGRQAAAQALALGRGPPFQQPPPRHEQPPQRPRRRQRAGRRLGGQEQQPQQRPGQRSARAQEQGRGEGPLRAAVPPQQGVGGQAQQLREQRQSRRGRRQGPAPPRQQEAAEQGVEDRRGQQAPPQRVEEPPAPQGREVPPAAEQPGQVLPVAPGPAVQPRVIGERLRRKTVAQLHVPHVARAEEAALHRVVAQQLALRDAAFQAAERGVDVDQPLPGKVPAVEQVHPKLAAAPVVGVHAALPGKDAGEIGPRRVGQVDAEPRGQNAVAGAHDAPFLVQDGGVQRMQHRADQASRRTG